MGIDTSQLGSVRRAEERRVGGAPLGQFAAALNDTNEAHLEGRWAAPVFANLPPMHPTIEAPRLVTRDSWSLAAHDFNFDKATRPGMRLIAEAEPVGIRPGQGGVNIVVRSRTRTSDGEFVDDQYLTGIVPGGAIGRPAGVPVPEGRPAQPVCGVQPNAQMTYALDADQTHRYAGAARDYSEYRRGTDLFHEYLNRSDATAETVRGGGDHSGDLLRQDERGLHYFAGSKKNMIRRNGENISTVEVKAVLRSHPKNLEVAVMPAPDELRGEEVMAFNELKQGVTPDELPPPDIIEFCRSRLAAYKIPRYSEYRTADFALTPSMKVQKQSLTSERANLIAGVWDREAGALR